MKYCYSNLDANLCKGYILIVKNHNMSGEIRQGLLVRWMMLLIVKIDTRWITRHTAQVLLVRRIKKLAQRDIFSCVYEKRHRANSAFPS